MPVDDTRAVIRFGVIMEMVSNHGREDAKQDSTPFQIVLPKPKGDYEGDDGPFYELTHWIETHLGRPDSIYKTFHMNSFEYVSQPEYFAVWDRVSNMMGFGFVDDRLATLFKMFNE